VNRRYPLALLPRGRRKGEPQFLRHHLGQRRADVLADLGLAGVDGDLAGLVDVQPGPQFLRPRPAGPLLGQALPRNQADDNAAAQQLEEVAPVQLELVGRLLEQLVALRLDVRGQGPGGRSQQAAN
jgi:hypothetical protein